MDLDSKILSMLNGTYLTTKEITERVNYPKERIDVRMKQLRKWRMVKYKRVDVGGRGRKPLAYTASD